MTREEKVAKAQILRAEGLKLREIAKKMGVAVQTVNSWLCDPDGSKAKARKASYTGICSECGGPTPYGGGRVTLRCGDCRRGLHVERDDKIAQRWEEGKSNRSISAELGLSEGAVHGVTAKGVRSGTLKPHRLGGDADEREARRSQIIAWRREGLTNDEIADRLGTSKASVSVMFQWCVKKGLEVPPAPSSEPRISPSDLQAAWQEGLTLKEIARRFEFRTSSAVSSQIFRLRRRGHHFPARKSGPKKAVAA